MKTNCWGVKTSNNQLYMQNKDDNTHKVTSNDMILIFSNCFFGNNNLKNLSQHQCSLSLFFHFSPILIFFPLPLQMSICSNVTWFPLSPNVNLFPLLHNIFFSLLSNINFLLASTQYLFPPLLPNVNNFSQACHYCL